jgi:glutamate formiminotransferase/glutamate formiminotransferase/formiminotetrahydrofolate cyclodeaminase
MTPPILLAVPNVSEGRDAQAIAAIGEAFAGADADSALRLLDVHTDGDHHRSVFTIAARPLELADTLLRGARATVRRVDVMTRAPSAEHAGQHPHVGALDVVPIVYLEREARGAACAEALVVADRIGEELEVPVFLYDELSGGDPDSLRTRAELRRGGVAGLRARIAGGEDAIAPDFGPPRMHPSAGATLLAARPPLVAFNLQLAPPADVQDARRVAALIREGGEQGLPGVRAIGIALGGDVAQVSMNVERPFETPLASVLAAVRAHADVVSAELVGLAPAAALEGFPGDIPLAGFDPARHLIENALGSC